MKKNHILKVTVLIFIAIFISQNSYAQMFWNQASSFTGSSSSYVSVPNSGSLNITGNFTVEAWINPASLSGASKGIISKGNALGTALIYGIRLTTAGRLTITTNGTQRLISRISNPLIVNKWTHISASYNSSTSLFSIYINGIIDTTATFAGSIPTSNSDSLFIGISGASTPFSGLLDEVRLWNRELSSAEVSQYMRTSLGTSSGIYNGLVLSMPFQKESSAGTRFSVKDFSGNGNNGNARNVTAIDQSFRPLQTISQNESLMLDGTEDYLAAKDTSTISPTSGITIECWVYPKTGGAYNLISKGNSYSLSVEFDFLKATINGQSLNSSRIIPINKWTHIAFTYSNATDSVAFYVNSNTPKYIVSTIGNINDTGDSLYIGGVPGSAEDLNGYLDEVRICDYAKTINEVDKTFYNSIDAFNDPNNFGKDISYNFDGSVLDNCENGGPRLIFRNNARFSHPSTVAGQPVSPVNRSSLNRLTNGFYISTAIQRIPNSGTSGNVINNSTVNLNYTAITDLNLFVAINHTNLSNLEITLLGPNGDSAKVFNNKNSNSSDNNIITVFDDQADSTMVSGRYSSFYSEVKPESNLNSVFAGDIMFGNWRLIIRDEVTNDTGFIYTWGIQFNNQNVRGKDVTSVITIQGFYDPALNEMISRDTIKAYLREFTSPYSIVDSSIAYFTTFGVSSFNFPNSENNHPYYLAMKHRNSIETWSSDAVMLRFSELTYDFTIVNTSAFGNNLVSVDASPSRFAFYSGDINQDGNVDLTDVIQANNEAANFLSGYAQSDVTGNNTVDLTDVILTFNNANIFVQSILP